ncbi:MAG: hypothetical protein KBF82_00685 [Chitinophagaceae bacterium]|nr:hypothetical protein [Chitinophagaceae bacterium]MBP9102348.1 hypothetical protein [Chitinophagaceae bacterium]
MKLLNQLLITGLLFFTTNLNAQNVAINNDGATPDASAMLEVTSQEKGFLPPRMRTIMRLAIVSPATGLMVYDTDTQSYWYRGVSSWIELSDYNNGHWETNNQVFPVNRNRYFVGISNSNIYNPSTYGVLGLMKVHMQSDNVEDVLSIQRRTSGVPQNGIGSGIVFRTELNDQIMTTSGRISSILENVNTVANKRTALRFQVLGPNDLSDNNLYFNLDGLSVGSHLPAASMLDVKGTISLTDEINNPSKTGTANLLPVCYGNVESDGTVNTGSNNFSIDKTGVGRYVITISSHTFHYQTYLATVTPSFVSTPRIAVTTSFNGDLIVRVFDITGNLIDCNFNFVVHRP